MAYPDPFANCTATKYFLFSFLGRPLAPITNGSSADHDLSQQVPEQGSTSENRESLPSQHSVESSSTTDTQISPPSPQSTTADTHSLPLSHYHSQCPPNTTSETSNPNLLSLPNSGECSSSQESSPHSTASTTPLISRPGNVCLLC